MEFRISESLFASIEKNRVSFLVFGELICSSKLNYLPIIPAKFNGQEKTKVLSTHFCIKSLNDDVITFSPPSGLIQLLMWQLNTESIQLPLAGKFSLIENGKEIEINLEIQVSRFFSEMKLEIPFYGRGAVVNHSLQKTSGQLKVNKPKAIFLLILDSTSNECSLKGNIEFEKDKEGNEIEKVFVSLKDKNQNFSGISFSDIRIDVSPQIEAKISSSCSTENKKYWISE